MAQPPTTKTLLGLILQDCGQYGNGDPITILDIKNLPYYKNNSNGYVPKPPYKDTHYKAVDLIKKGYAKKPASNTDRGQVKVKYYTWTKDTAESKASITVHDAAAAMHDYAFRPEYNVNAAAMSVRRIERTWPRNPSPA